jgi:hypothetical protein
VRDQDLFLRLDRARRYGGDIAPAGLSSAQERPLALYTSLVLLASELQRRWVRDGFAWLLPVDRRRTVPHDPERVFVPWRMTASFPCTCRRSRSRQRHSCIRIDGHVRVVSLKTSREKRWSAYARCDQYRNDIVDLPSLGTSASSSAFS